MRPSWQSENPSAFTARSFVAEVGRPFAATSRSAATIFSTSRRNQGSKRVAAAISSTVRPARIAWPAMTMRSGVGIDNAAMNACLLPSPGSGMTSRPEKPVSRLRKPFCNASAKLRPMLIASPTDFIEVVR